MAIKKDLDRAFVIQINLAKGPSQRGRTPALSKDAGLRLNSWIKRDHSTTQLQLHYPSAFTFSLQGSTDKTTLSKTSKK